MAAMLAAVIIAAHGISLSPLGAAGRALQSALPPLPRVDLPALPEALSIAPGTIGPLTLPTGWTLPPAQAEADLFDEPFWAKATETSDPDQTLFEKAFHAEQDGGPFLALLAAFSLAFRAVGYVGFAASATAIAAILLPHLPTSVLALLPPEALALLRCFLHSSADFWASADPLERAAAGWLGTEGLFFTTCHALAARMSSFRPYLRAPGPLSTERRAEIWRRILSDQTISPRTFVSQWFFRVSPVDAAAQGTRAGDAACRACGHGGAPSALLGYAASLLGLRTGAGVVRGLEAPIRYEDLRRADVNHWLAAGLFEKHLHELSREERTELNDLVDALERKCGSPLLDPARAEEVTPGIRAMRMATDDIQWLHRPLLYYCLTHLLYGEIVTPVTYRAKGFKRRSHDGLGYYIKHDRRRTEGGGWERVFGGGMRLASASAAAAAGKGAGTFPSSGCSSSSSSASSSASSSSSGSSSSAFSSSAFSSSAFSPSAPSSASSSSPREAVVVLHGVGVGPGPYLELADRISRIEIGGGSFLEAPEIACPWGGAAGEAAGAAVEAMVGGAAKAGAEAASVASAAAVNLPHWPSRPGQQGGRGVRAERAEGGGGRGAIGVGGLFATSGGFHLSDEASSAGSTGLRGDTTTHRVPTVASADRRTGRAVIALDVSQFCQHIDPRQPASPERFAAQLEAILDENGLDSAVLVGHSLGSAYCNYFRHHAPQRTSGLCLIDPICCMLHHAQISRESAVPLYQSLRITPRARNLLEGLRARFLARQRPRTRTSPRPRSPSCCRTHVAARVPPSPPLPPSPPPPLSMLRSLCLQASRQLAQDGGRGVLCPTRDLHQQRDHASHALARGRALAHRLLTKHAHDHRTL